MIRSRLTFFYRQAPCAEMTGVFIRRSSARPLENGRCADSRSPKMILFKGLDGLVSDFESSPRVAADGQAGRSQT
jgi:hypothetical protein